MTDKTFGIIGANASATFTTNDAIVLNGGDFGFSTVAWDVIEFGNSIFCTLGQNSISCISSDGLTYTVGGAHGLDFVQGAKFTGTRWVAIDQVGLCSISTDGLTWSAGTALTTATGPFWASLDYDGTTLCAIGGNGTLAARSSDEGGTWSYGTLPSATWTALTNKSGVYAAVSSTGHSATSADHGATWTDHTTINARAWEDLKSNGTKFCAIGAGLSATSPDGSVWTEFTMPSSGSWTRLDWNNLIFCSIAKTSPTHGALAYSADGEIWTLGTSTGLFSAQPLIAAGPPFTPVPTGPFWTNLKNTFQT